MTSKIPYQHEAEQKFDICSSAFVKAEKMSAYDRIDLNDADEKGPYLIPKSRFEKARWMLILLLIAVASGLGFLAGSRATCNSETWEIAGDVSGFVPKFPHQLIAFQPPFKPFTHQDLETYDEAHLKAKWETMLPKGNGAVHIPSPENYPELPPPIRIVEGIDIFHGQGQTKSLSNQTYFATAFDHQLHCLYADMNFFYRLWRGEEGSGSPEVIEHFNHCIEYLRQTLVCFGDTTLEGSPVFEPEGTSGNGALRVCRNQEKMHSWLELHRVHDRKNIAL